jgi:hypothetical protein
MSDTLHLYETSKSVDIFHAIKYVNIVDSISTLYYLHDLKYNEVRSTAKIWTTSLSIY